ncbi:alanine racemase [Pseudoalteromonas fenneropenaei]|uniref:Alanine racemase n=1 Tax=Pseudoalteromonas fenneropenaei TaxID=1737459 RepID=A0ABV7CI36_9GAMM
MMMTQPQTSPFSDNANTGNYDVARLDNLDYEFLAKLAPCKQGQACYLLDLDRVTANFTEFKAAFAAYFKPLTIAYSFKTNYTPALCHHLQQLGCHAEVVSEMEYDIAVQAVGFQPDKIIVNGPVHSEAFVERILLAGAQFNVDAWYLLAMVAKVCEKYPQHTFRIAVRLSYGIEEGGFSRFGIVADEANLAQLILWRQQHPNCQLVGVHSHFSNSTRSQASFYQRMRGLLHACETLFKDKAPEFINLGGGFFGVMPPALAAQYGAAVCGFNDYASAINEAWQSHCYEYPATQLRDANKQAFKPTLQLEPGTALVANAMVFITQVLEVKQQLGRTLALLNGSNHNVNHKWQGETLPIQLVTDKPSVDEEQFDLVGNTCIEKDVLMTDVAGQVKAGDFVVFQYMGGYSNVLKQPFIHPCQAIICWQGRHLSQIKQAGDWQSILAGYSIPA